MGKISAKLRRWAGPCAAGYAYWCQGCEQMHSVRTEGPGSWGFNGDIERPTFTPSVLVTSGHYIAQWDRKECWCTYNAEHPDQLASFKCHRCHTFITDGTVQFLADCSHPLAGQTLPLPDLPDGIG